MLSDYIIHIHLITLSILKPRYGFSILTRVLDQPFALDLNLRNMQSKFKAEPVQKTVIANYIFKFSGSNETLFLSKIVKSFMIIRYKNGYIHASPENQAISLPTKPRWYSLTAYGLSLFSCNANSWHWNFRNRKSELQFFGPSRGSEPDPQAQPSL